jgi:hypothetical protein
MTTFTTIPDSTGLFPRWQPEYAARGVATFPVMVTDKAKRPAITHYGKVGLPGSAALAMKRQFANADAFGFMAGVRSSVTILDIDSSDEKILAKALDRHGSTPLIVRTGSGKFHAYFRYHRERRRIRPWRGLPIDLLGDNGFVVGPPSLSAKGQYEIIKGKLADLERLPPLRNLDLEKPSKTVKQGARNNALFRHCMKAAHRVDCFDKLLDVARTFNKNCEPPMEDGEVMHTAQSAWNYTERGQNRFGQHGAWFPYDEVAAMVSHQDAFLLLAFLRAHQGPASTFMCANGLADQLKWTRKRLADARRCLIEFGYFSAIRQAGRGHAALFRWRK